MKKQFFKFYANCLLVKGHTKSVICDLQNGRYRDVPNELTALFNEEMQVRLEDIETIFEEEEDRQGFKLFLDYFVEHGWAFYTNTPDLFPALNMRWETPGKLTNAIIDIDENSSFDLAQIIEKLNDLGCTGLQVRFYTPADSNKFETIAKAVEFSEFEYVEIVAKHNEQLKQVFYDEFQAEHKRISRFVITAVGEGPTSDNEDVEFVTDDLHFANDCGVIEQAYFSPNIEHFTESMHFNSCLNRKISIAPNGEIRNCPSMKRSFGNVEEVTLESVALDEKFQEIWSLKKDDIETCKDCEYRYICSDCRAFTVNDTIDGKPSKCNYDPYKGIWNE